MDLYEIVNEIRERGKFYVVLSSQKKRKSNVLQFNSSISVYCLNVCTVHFKHQREPFHHHRGQKGFFFATVSAAKSENSICWCQ